MAIFATIEEVRAAHSRRNTRIPSLFDAYLDEEFSQYLNDEDFFLTDKFDMLQKAVNMGWDGTNIILFKDFINVFKSNQIWFSNIFNEYVIENNKECFKCLQYLDYFKMLDRDFYDVVCQKLIDEQHNYEKMDMSIFK